MNTMILSILISLIIFSMTIDAQPIGYKSSLLTFQIGIRDRFLDINSNETNALQICANECDKMEDKCQFFNIGSNFLNITTCVFFSARPCQYKRYDNTMISSNNQIYEKIAPIVVKPGIFRTFCYSRFFGNATHKLTIFSPLVGETIPESLSPSLQIRNYSHQGLVHNSSLFREECTNFCTNHSCGTSWISVHYENALKGFIYECSIYNSSPYDSGSELYFDATFYGMCSPYVEDTITIHKEIISHVCENDIIQNSKSTINIYNIWLILIIFIVKF